MRAKSGDGIPFGLVVRLVKILWTYMAKDFDKLSNCFLVKHERTVTLTGRT